MQGLQLQPCHVSHVLACIPQRKHPAGNSWSDGNQDPNGMGDNYGPKNLASTVGDLYFTKMVIPNDYVCGLLLNGTVMTFGPFGVPVPLPGDLLFSDLAWGTSETSTAVGLHRNGTIFRWNSTHLTPVKHTNSPLLWKSISYGAQLCAISVADDAYCFDGATPSLVAGSFKWMQIAASGLTGMNCGELCASGNEEIDGSCPLVL